MLGFGFFVGRLIKSTFSPPFKEKYPFSKRTQMRNRSSLENFLVIGFPSCQFNFQYSEALYEFEDKFYWPRVCLFQFLYSRSHFVWAE